MPRPHSFYSDEFTLLRLHLRTTRLNKGLTQAEVAERMDKPLSYISKCELGERRMDFIEIRGFCRAIEKPFSEFVQEFEELVSETQR